MKIFHYRALLALSLFAGTATLIQAAPKSKGKVTATPTSSGTITTQELNTFAPAPASSGAPAQVRLDEQKVSTATASATDASDSHATPRTIPGLPNSGSFGTAGDEKTAEPSGALMVRRASIASEEEIHELEEKSDRRLSFDNGVTVAEIKRHAAAYHYNRLQSLILEHEKNELVMQQVRNLATRTGDFCLLFEIVRHDVHKLRNSGPSSLTPEQKQAAMINMLTHYILTMCESMILIADLCTEEAHAFGGWEIINSIYAHWFRKYLLDDARRASETFSLEALIASAVNNCRLWFEQEADGIPSFTSVPHTVTWFNQTTCGYGVASVYTYNLAFSADSTPRKKDEIRAASRPGLPKAFRSMRLATLTHVEAVLKTKNLDNLFAIAPEAIASRILGDRSISPIRHIE